MIETNMPQTSVKSISHTHSLMGRDFYISQPLSQMLQESLTSAIAEVEQELQRKLQQLLSNQEQKLSEIGENINALTQKLEQEILDFQKFAGVANHIYRSLKLLGEQTKKKTNGNHQSLIPDELNIVATHPSKLPVVEKYGFGYILKDKTVDLSKVKLSIHNPQKH